MIKTTVTIVVKTPDINTLKCTTKVCESLCMQHVISISWLHVLKCTNIQQ